MHDADDLRARLATAERLLKQESYAAAVPHIQELLDWEYDFYHHESGGERVDELLRRLLEADSRAEHFARLAAAVDTEPGMPGRYRLLAELVVAQATTARDRTGAARTLERLRALEPFFPNDDARRAHALRAVEATLAERGVDLGDVAHPPQAE